MASESRQSHWENVYTSKGENEVSWFQESPAPSLALIAEIGTRPHLAIIDIGGGASRLVDHLIEQGFLDITVLDLSAAALDAAKARLGERASRAHWLVADATNWQPSRSLRCMARPGGVSFLTEARDREAYVARLRAGAEDRRPRHHRDLRARWSREMQRPAGRALRRGAPWANARGRIRAQAQRAQRPCHALGLAPVVPVQRLSARGVLTEP